MGRPLESFYFVKITDKQQAQLQLLCLPALSGVSALRRGCEAGPRPWREGLAGWRALLPVLTGLTYFGSSERVYGSGCAGNPGFGPATARAGHLYSEGLDSTVLKGLVFIPAIMRLKAGRLPCSVSTSFPLPGREPKHQEGPLGAFWGDLPDLMQLLPKDIN